MQCLVLYHSFTGNTEKVTNRIEKVLQTEDISYNVIKVDNTKEIDLYKYDLIFMGTPVIQCLPCKPILDFIKTKLDYHRKRKDIIPKSPKLKGKYAVCYCTFSGPHTGIREAIPAIKYMEQFFEHLRFSVIGRWYIVGEFKNNDVLSTQGVLGDIRGRPNEKDLMEVELKVKRILQKVKCTTQSNNIKLANNFVPKPLQFLSEKSEVLEEFKGLVEVLKKTSSLDECTQYLIKIALSAAYKCKDCLKFHIKEALENGVTEIEIKDALYLGTTLGGTSYLGFAYEVLEELNLA